MDEWMNQRNVFYAMDNGGPPNSQQFRPLSYADVCRPGTLSDHTSALSAAYHSRYLASLPLSTTGPSHPFLGGMFPSSSIPPATSFRATSAGLRQFWPPTPPPEGYGRYGINTSLFPLFGTVSPPSETSAYMAVSRLGTTSHLPNLVDNQKVDQSFLSPGYNMPSSLTCGSHVHPTTTFSPVIPGLEKHTSFSHMPLSSKDISQGSSESHNSKAVVNPYKHDKYSSNQRAKADGLLDKVDHRKLSSSSHKEKQEDVKPVRKHEARPNSRTQSQNKLSPCEIDINYQSSTIKTDILSPPLESPKPISPKLLGVKSQECSPMNSPALIPSTAYNPKGDSQCLTCAAHLKGIDTSTKSSIKNFSIAENSPEVLCGNKDKTDLMSHIHINSSSAEMANAVIGQQPKSGSSNNSFNSSTGQETLQPVHSSISDATYNAHGQYFPVSSKQRDVTKVSHSMNIGEQSKKTPFCADVERNKNLQEIKHEVSDLKLCNNQVSKLEVMTTSPGPNKCKNRSPSRVKVVEPQKVPKVCQNILQVSSDSNENGCMNLSHAPTMFTNKMQHAVLQNPSSKSYTGKNSPSTVQRPFIKVDSEENSTKYPMVSAKTDIDGSNPCSSNQKASPIWVKAAISPFNRQKDSSSIADNPQVASLRITKQMCEVPVSIPNPTNICEEDTNIISSAETVKITVENISPVNAGVVGVCHPNSKKTIPIVAFESKLSSPVSHSEIATEVHVSSKSSFQTITHSPSPINSIKASSVLNASIHSKTLKSERLTARRTKVGDMDKILSRGSLATLAPKLTKKATFLNDSKTSHHTIATSSSVSSTSIVFPASVNPCIPVGIAIAQQRQDSSTTSTVGKVSSIPSTTAAIIPSVTHPTQISSEIQSTELLRDQKPQETSGNADPSNYLVTQGPTILSRQWESEAVTRATLSSPWVAHGPIVAPALWLGQGAYAAAATPNAPAIPAPPPPTAPVEASSLALPPGGYQLARDSITGHLFLIPAANIVERAPLWPSYGASAPIQQVVTQQHHTQFEQVIPQVSESEPIQDCMSLTMQQTQHMGEPTKELDVVTISSPPNNMALSTCKPEEQLKSEEKRDCAVPMASGQTFTFTTFPTNCDPSSFSYVLQSSTVMHLAHTQTASSLQADSGKRSQGTSPLHRATPSPNNQETAIDDESDNDSESVTCSETTQVELFQQNQSVTTAIQVDMDSQTNSEEDEDETYHRSQNIQNIQMSDSANQTESLVTDSEKSDMGEDFNDFSSETSLDKRYPISQDSNLSKNSQAVSDLPLDKKEEKDAKVALEVLASETELAPSLPVESQPVMDFIDHHGLNLLVDSIEEFASREQTQQQSEPIIEKSEYLTVNVCDKNDYSQPKSNIEVAPMVDRPYGNLDPTCTDGLGLLCALAEQRFLEESLNVDNEKKEITTNLSESKDFSASIATNYNDSSEPRWDFESTQGMPPEYVPEHLKACELEMRKRLADLQRKYKEKEMELARLNPNIILDESESEQPKRKLLGNCRKRKSMKSFTTSKLRSSLVLSKRKTIGNKSLTLSTQRLIVKKSYFQQKKMKMLNNNADSFSTVCSKKQPLMKQKKTQFHKIQDMQSGRNKLVAVRQSKLCSISQNNKIHNITKKKNPSSGAASFSGTTKKTLSMKTVRKTHLKKIQSTHLVKRTKSVKRESTDEAECLDEMKSDDSKMPIFDESAWFIRRSERIFLSDARLPMSQQSITNESPKKTILQLAMSPIKLEAEPKEKKVKIKKVASPSTRQDMSESSDSDSSTSDSESSSQSDNIPLCRLIEQSSEKEKCKHSPIDSDESSALSEDIPLSVLKVQNSTKVPLKSCILTSTELQDKTRVLILDEGLFYAGHITAIQAPDVYGIILDGERAHRPHIFSREEILNAAVLEIKPDDVSQLPEGCRICAYWSQQYRCLYPGTVAKATSPLPDSAILYVEFDDGDSGRIPLEDIRILPPDFPIVSMEPNPLLILGKRRARIDSECANEQKKHGLTSGVSKAMEKDTKKFKKQKLDINDEGSTKNEYTRLSNVQSVNEDVKKSESPKRKNNDNSKISRDQSVKMLEKESSAYGSKLGTGKSSSNDRASLSMVVKPKKHKKHKDDHKHHHRHHHHHHHHHKKHKTGKQIHVLGSSIVGTVIAKCDKPSGRSHSVSTSENYQTFCSEQKSELTMKIMTSPSPHTTHDQDSTNHDEKDSINANNSTTNENQPAKKPKSKKGAAEGKPEKRKDRVPSVEKSKIAAFLPVRQLWRWSGKGYKRPGAKGKGKKEFYRAIQRGKEMLRVGDCAVFLSTGRPHLPYIGRIETMWESWGGKMDVKVKWFYHPEETKSSKKLVYLKQGALFQSPHFDENDVQTISHKCEVLPWEQYLKKKQELIPERASYSSLFDNNDTYYLAGTYDPITGSLVMEANIPKIPSD